MTFPSDLPPPATTPPRRHFGKRPIITDIRDIWLASYLDAPKLIDSAQAPALPDWAAVKTPAGYLPSPDHDPLFNDRAGSCVFSGAGHMVNLLNQHTSRPLYVNADMVRDAYATTGYDPETGAGDNGANIREHLLKPWKALGWWGTKAIAYARVDPTNVEEVALATWLGGGLIGGYNLPADCFEQNDGQGRPQWSMPEGGWAPGEGPSASRGHCIYTHGVRSGNTWGQSLVMDQPYILATCDELWLVLLDIWQVGDRAPNGFAWQQLVADAEARAAG